MGSESARRESIAIERDGEFPAEAGIAELVERSESGTAAAASAPAERADGYAMLAQETHTCPADLAEIEVVATAIPDGGAMVFSVADESQEALRARLRLFAKVHELHRLEMAAADRPVEKPRAAEGEPSAAPVPEDSASTGRIPPKLEENPPPQRFADMSALVHSASEVAVVETDEGARVEIRIADRRRVRALRSELREDAAMLSQGSCPLALSIAES